MRPLPLFISLLSLLAALPLSAQLPQGAWLTWEEFLSEYVDENAQGEDDSGLSEAQINWLEEMARQPRQLNVLTRRELLELPFINEAQADSLLSYARKKGGLRSLGELQLISGWDYFTRRYLSLFVRCDTLPPRSPAPLADEREARRILPKLTKGSHEIETRLDLPFYQREGYKEQAEPTETNYFVGNALHHVVRYRYAYEREAAYGLTAEKDAGEPVGKQGFYPYDYLSGYFYINSAVRPLSFVIGDYEVRGGRGLLMGRPLFAGREQAVQGGRRAETTFRPHTSTDENRFFRGVAAAYKWRGAEVMAFLSYRKLDARFNEAGDTARSVLTTGYHRTVSEVLRRRRLGCLTAGLHLGCGGKQWGVSLDAYAAHYDHLLFPETRYYNLYYFRGQTAGGLSANYYLSQGKWAAQGEVAADHKLHLATEHFLSFSPTAVLTLSAQVRLFSPRFVSLYGHALQQGSRVANEQGILFGARYRSRNSWEVGGYLDVFRFPKPTYTAKLGGARGVEGQLQGKKKISARWQLLARYRLKIRERTVSGYDLLEFRQTHRLRLAALCSHQRYELSTQIDGTLALRQTGKRSLGGMVSARALWKALPALTLKAFGGIFFTDDYESAVYAYEPQLPRAASFNAFAYHGARLVALCNWRVLKSLTLGLRFSSSRYFNHSRFSSGPSALLSAWKNDAQLQLIWRLPRPKR